MNNRWFLIPTKGTGELGDGYKPKYVESIQAIKGRSGRRTGDDKYIVRIFGPEQALTKVQSKDDTAVPTDSKIEQILEEITDKQRSLSEWENSIFIKSEL